MKEGKEGKGRQENKDASFVLEIDLNKLFIRLRFIYLSKCKEQTIFLFGLSKIEIIILYFLCRLDFYPCREMNAFVE